jgi:hypothetical protein
MRIYETIVFLIFIIKALRILLVLFEIYFNIVHIDIILIHFLYIFYFLLNFTIYIDK